MSTQNKVLFKIEKRDGSNWKRVLLTWINHCEFLGRNYFNIEQTNIYEFFEKFQEHIPNWLTCQVDLTTFIKEYYPAIELHTDDNNQISSSDYMYIYSILLHFCCVKHPTEYFQTICQNFHETYQQAIAIFFKGLLGKDIIDKALLRKMIAEASLHNSLSNMPIESPIKTRLNSKISPPTPKTHMLEEKNRELHTLKAALETEKYERGFFELQNKQHEEKIKKLEQQQRILISEIHELKERLNSQFDFDDNSPNKIKTNNQQSNRLQKLINEKEDLIFNLKKNLDTLSEEKDSTKEKLKYAQKEVNVCLSKISELELERFKIMEDMEKKDQTIQVLSEAKKELEDIINESRSQNGRFTDLNNSLDYLDLSSSHNSNSSSSLCSPENLGRSVVDIQLREKECENVYLKAEIDKLQNDNSKLSRHISEIIREHSEIFDICQENLIADENAEEITHNFIIFENYFTKLVENYKQVNQNVKKFYEDKLALNVEVQNLNDKILEFEKLIGECRETMQASCGDTDENNKMKDIINFKTELNDYVDKVNKELYDKEQSINNLNELSFKFNKLHLENFKSQDEFTRKIQNITGSLLIKCEKIDEILINNVELNKQIEMMQSDMQDYLKSINNLKNVNSNLNSEKENLIEENSEIQEKLIEQERKFLEMEKKFDNTKILNEQINKEFSKLRDEIKEYSKNLEESLNNSKNKQIELEKLGQENFLISKENEDLISKVTSLNEDIQKLKEIYSKEDIEKSEKIEGLTQNLNERNLVVDTLTKNNDDYIKNINSLENTITDLKAKLEQYKISCFEINKFRETLEEDKQKLTGDIDELKRKLETNKNETQCLKTKNDTLIEECNKNSIDVSSFKNQIEELEKKTIDQQVELFNLQELIKKFREKEKSLTSEKEKLQNQFETNLESNKILEQKLSETENILNSRLNEMSLLQENLSVSQEQKGDLNLKFSVLMEKSEESAVEITNLKSKIEEFEKQCEDQITEIYRLETINTTQRVAIEELYTLLNERVDEILNLQIAFDKLKVENDQKNSKMKSLLDDFNKETTKSNYLETEIDKIKITVSKLEKENSEFSNTIESLTISKMNTEDEIEEWKSLVEAKSNELKNINSEFESNLINIITQIENNIENFLEPDSLIDFLETSVSANSILLRLRNAINALLNTNSLQLKKREEFAQNINILNSNLQSALEQKNNSERCLQETEQKRNDLEKRLVELNEILNSNTLEHSIEVSKIVGKLKDLEKEKIKLEDKFDEILQQLDEKNEKLVNMKNNLQDISEIAKEKNSISEKLQEKINENDKFMQQNYDLQNKVEKLLEQNSILNEQNKNLCLESENKNINYETLNNRFEEKLKELEEIKNENFKITSENWEFKCERDDLAKKLELKVFEIDEFREATKETIEKLQDENKNLSDNLDKLNIKIETNQSELININMLSTEYQNEISQLKLDCENYVEKLNNKTNELKKLSEEHNNLKSTNSSIETELNITMKLLHESKIYESKYEDLKVEFTSLTEQLTNTQSKCDKITSELNETSNENEFLSENLRKIEKTLQQTNSNLEKKCFRLGEEQAKSIKLEKENETLKKSNSEINANLETLQKDYIKLQDDCKSLRMKLSDQEKIIESQNNQNQMMSRENDKLLNDLREISESEMNLKESNMNLHAIQEEDKINLNRLTETLKEMSQIHNKIKNDNMILEENNMKLLDQINNLNQEIDDYKRNSNTEKNEFALDLEKQLRNACEENSNLNDKISKISIQLEIINTALQNTKNELERSQAELSIFEKDKQLLENSIKDYQLKIEQLQANRDQYIIECKKENELLKEKLIKLENLLQQSEKKIEEYYKEIELTKLKSNKICKYDELQKRYHLMEQAYNNEKSETKKLKSDLEIFNAKLYKSRQFNEENEKKWFVEKKNLAKLSEEKIKENRLELEGKLEKMKNKMKTIYNEEVAKLKKKYESEIFDYQAEIQILRGKTEKYDEHIRTMSKRIFALNEKICGLERDNNFMECKIKDYEHQRNSLRPQRSNSTMLNAHHPVTNFLGSNLRMEDEEGEILNNTYLADGRVSDFGIRDSISTQEILYRNSLAPPHLRSSYLAQYKDTQLTEEDVKDGVPPIGLDDSLTSLMSGHRKKLAGTTSYKKPGPPTPSKSSGRYSFGGSTEVHASILKEYNENNEQKKTPAKFKLFSSRSHSKDEQEEYNGNYVQNFQHHQRRLSTSRRRSLSRLLAKNFSSTPRQSKINFDNRRELDKIINQNIFTKQIDNKNDEKLIKEMDQKETADPNNYCDGIEKSEEEINSINKNCNARQKNEPHVNINIMKEQKLIKSKKFLKWRSNKIYSSESGTSDTNSPYLLTNINNKHNKISSETSSINSNQTNNDKDSENEQILNKITKTKRRISIYHRGNVYSRSELPSNVLKEQVRAKAKLDRNKNFNKYRKSLNEIRLRKSILSMNGNYDENNQQCNNQDAVFDETNTKRNSLSIELNLKIPNQINLDSNYTDTRLSEVFDTDIRNYDNQIFNNHNMIDNNLNMDLFEKKSREYYDNPSLSDITSNKIDTNDATLQVYTAISQQQLDRDKDALYSDIIDIGLISNASSNNSTTTQLTGSHRTLYANSNITSRKIPQINSMVVSRNSFYFKNDEYNIEEISFFGIFKLWLNQKGFFNKFLFKYICSAGIFIIVAIVLYLIF